MLAQPEGAIRTGYGLGPQCGGRFAGHAAGGEAFYVVQEERNDLMVLDDFQQILPVDRLPREGSDEITVGCFLRPAKTCQHEIKFAIHRLPRIMLDVHATAKSQAGIIG
jgi:hypothetical protein